MNRRSSTIRKAADSDGFACAKLFTIPLSNILLLPSFNLVNDRSVCHQTDAFFCFTNETAAWRLGSNAMQQSKTWVPHFGGRLLNGSTWMLLNCYQVPRRFAIKCTLLDSSFCSQSPVSQYAFQGFLTCQMNFIHFTSTFLARISFNAFH